MTVSSDLLQIVFVSALWGTTNPLLRIGATSSDISEDVLKQYPLLLRPIIYLWNVFLCWKFSVPFLLNQCASVLNVWLIATQPLTLVVPLVNSLTFLFTALTGRIVGETSISFTVFVGTTLITAGIAMTLLFD